jgi:two-component system response regulator MtrA
MRDRLESPYGATVDTDPASTMSEVLIVEDDDGVRHAMSLVLRRAGFEVDSVADGSAALHHLTSSTAVVLLDLMLPGVDGFTVCDRIRGCSSVPIIMVTARTGTSDIVAGLERGADDYVTKPFEPEVLVARVRAAVRRSRHNVGGTILQCRDITVDERAVTAHRGEVHLSLTTIEFRLLAELLRHAGITLSRNDLLKSVWGYDYLGDSRLVDMAVKRLRDKLAGGARSPHYITTVRGHGYRFETN